MAENPSNGLERTIGVIQATVEDLKNRFEDFAETLSKIESKIGTKIEENFKLGTENSYEIKAMKIDFDNLKIKFSNMKAEIKEEKTRKNTWWSNITNKVVAALLIAALLGGVGFLAGEYTKNLEYKTPPNQTHQSVKKV